MGSHLEGALGWCAGSLPCTGVVKQLSCHGIKRILGRIEEMIIFLLLALVKHAAEFCILNAKLSETV